VIFVDIRDYMRYVQRWAGTDKRVPIRFPRRMRSGEVTDDEVIEAIRSVPEHYATARYQARQTLGFPTSLASMGTQALNTTSPNFTFQAFQFVPDRSGLTLSEMSFYVSAVASSLGPTDVVMDLYSTNTSTYKPNAALESGKATSVQVTTAGWYRCTGFTTGVTAGVCYYGVVRNVNSTQNTNFPTLRFPSASVLGGYAGGNISGTGWPYRAVSTDGGSTWTINAGNNLRVGYSDGSYDGFPISNAGVNSTDLVYSTRESGIKFTWPANVKGNVCGMGFWMGSTVGVPTGSPRYGLWTGSSPANQGYTNSGLTSMFGQNGQWFPLMFNSNIQVAGGTVTRCTMGETANADASSKAFRLQELTWDTDSNSLALKPIDGTAVKTYYDGSSWTDDSPSGVFASFVVFLDPAGEFASTGGGSGGVTRARQAAGVSPVG
jgi:hypothetical protein